MDKINRIVNNTTLNNFWKDVDKVDIPTTDNPLCHTEQYRYYVQAKLLIRVINGKIVGHLIGESATRSYKLLGGEIFITTEYLVEYMAYISGFTANEIVSKSQKEELVCCRQIIIWHYTNLIKANILKKTLADIGSIFNKDHATAIHAFNAIDEEDKYKKSFQVEYKHKFVHHLMDSFDIYKSDKFKAYRQIYGEKKHEK